MATTYPEIGNSTKWEPYFAGNFSGEKLSDGTYRPIPAIETQYTTNAKLLFVGLDSFSAPSYYKTAGWLTQQVYVNWEGGSTPNARADKSWLLLLNRLNLIIPNPGFPDYNVKIDVPYWYDDINIFIWQYTGPATDAIAFQLNAMDAKLNVLLGN